MHQAHAAAAAARRRLDHHRQPGLDRLRFQRLVGLIVALVARHARHACRDHADLRGALVAHGLDRSRVRTDEDQAGVLHRPGEIGTFGQETVARMDRLRAGGLRRRDDVLDHQVGVFRRRRADAHRLVRLAHVQRIAVGIAIHRHGLVTLLLGATDHPHRDLAAIGDQHLREIFSESAHDSIALCSFNQSCAERSNQASGPKGA